MTVDPGGDVRLRTVTLSHCHGRGVTVRQWPTPPQSDCHTVTLSHCHSKEVGPDGGLAGEQPGTFRDILGDAGSRGGLEGRGGGDLAAKLSTTQTCGANIAGKLLRISAGVAIGPFGRASTALENDIATSMPRAGSRLPALAPAPAPASALAPGSRLWRVGPRSEVRGPRSEVRGPRSVQLWLSRFRCSGVLVGQPRRGEGWGGAGSAVVMKHRGCF